MFTCCKGIKAQLMPVVPARSCDPCGRAVEGRIAGLPLPGGGIELWFDQSELRGGDAWDQKIRRHTQDCALFIPIISGHTRARAQGYFRLEWRLADQRTLADIKADVLMAPLLGEARHAALLKKMNLPQ
jgi:hypothetical protein